MARLSAWTRLVVLVCASLIPFGAHYLKHSLGPLKSYLVKESGPPAAVQEAADGAGGQAVDGAAERYEAPNATNQASAPPVSGKAPRFSHAEFGAFLGAVSWPNLVLPFLAGMVVDEKGHEFSAMLFTSVALLGHVLFCVFVTPPLASFAPALAGRIVYGFGEGGTGIVQGAIIGTWFEGDTMAFSIGFTESVHYLANWVGKALPALFAERYGGAISALWVGCAFLFLSVVVAFIYMLFVKSETDQFVFALQRGGASAAPPGSARSSPHNPEDRRTSGGEELDALIDSQGERSERVRSSSAVSWYGAMQLPEEADDAQRAPEAGDHHRNRLHYVLLVQKERVRTLPLAFWLVGVLHFVFSNLHNLFGGFAADFFHESAHLTPAHAGLIASLDSLLPVFLAPFVGIYVDAYGGRVTICAVSAVAAVVGYALFLQPALTSTRAVVAMVFLSVSTSTTPTLVKSAVPLVVPSEALGTAFGIYSMFESLGGGLGHIAFGLVREISTSYHDDILALIWLALFALAVSVATLYNAPSLNGPTVQRAAGLRKP